MHIVRSFVIRQFMFAALAAGATAVYAGGALANSYSGRAIGASLSVTLPTPNTLVFADTGPLPETGGNLSASLLSIEQGKTLSSGTVSANTAGMDTVAASSAVVENLQCFGGLLQATHVEARTRITCGEIHGSTIITGLIFAGASVVVSGEANQTVSVPGVGTLVMNEQLTAPGAPNLTVRALHLTLAGGDELIVSSAYSDLSCVTPVRPQTWGALKQIYR